jgi:hypothetical protein
MRFREGRRQTETYEAAFFDIDLFLSPPGDILRHAEGRQPSSRDDRPDAPLRHCRHTNISHAFASIYFAASAFI